MNGETKIKMKENYLIGLANLVNGSMLGYEDTSCVNDYKQWIENYVNHSEQEIQSLKEVIKDLRKAIGRKEETIFELQHERVPYTNRYVDKIKDNWNKLEAYLLEKQDKSFDGKISFDDVLIKMQELEERI